MNRFESPTFEGVSVQLESADKPKVKAGGSSDSDVLNRYFSAIAQDMTLLATRCNTVSARAARLATGAAAQGGALGALFQSLSTRVDTVQASGRVLCDLHSTNYIDAGTSTAELSQLWGQATLPIRSLQDLLIQQDVYGNPLISPVVEISYQESTVSSVNTLDHSLFQVDPDAIYMLLDQQLWLRDRTVGQTYLWVKVRAPLEYLGLTPNLLEIWPCPCFAMNLAGVYVKKLGDASTYYSQDLTYLPKYSTSSGKVENFGPVRLHLNNEAITEVVLCIQLQSAGCWGLDRLKIYHTEYDPSGTVVFQDPFSRSVRGVVLRGKDPSSLAAIPVSTTGNTSTITLSSADTAKTPVVTGALMSV